MLFSSSIFLCLDSIRFSLPNAQFKNNPNLSYTGPLCSIQIILWNKVFYLPSPFPLSQLFSDWQPLTDMAAVVTVRAVCQRRPH